jgi:hypothetical protein
LRESQRSYGTPVFGEAHIERKRRARKQVAAPKQSASREPIATRVCSAYVAVLVVGERMSTNQFNALFNRTEAGETLSSARAQFEKNSQS